MRINVKHILIVTFTICLLLIIGKYVESIVYNPIGKSDCSILFQSSGKCRKCKTEDLIKLSFHGETFDIFKYKIIDVVLGEGYPRFNERWDGEDLKDNCVTSIWKKTPVNKEDSSLVYSVIDVNMVGVTSKLQKEIAGFCGSYGNFYCYIQNGSSNCYLFVYSRENNYLYYTRIKNLTL